MAKQYKVLNTQARMYNIGVRIGTEVPVKQKRYKFLPGEVQVVSEEEMVELRKVKTFCNLEKDNSLVVSLIEEKAKKAAPKAAAKTKADASLAE